MVTYVKIVLHNKNTLLESGEISNCSTKTNLFLNVQLVSMVTYMYKVMSKFEITSFFSRLIDFERFMY